MILKSLAFDDDGSPSKVIVEMTLGEALLIATWTGGTNDIQRNEIMPNGGAIGSDVYRCLVDGFFNRFWDDGPRDAMRDWTASK